MLDWLKPILGTNYTEEIDKAVSQEIGKLFVSRTDFNTLNETKKGLDTQLSELNGKLTTAQQGAADADTIRQQLKAAQDAMAASQKASAIRAGLGEYKLHNPDVLLKLLNPDAITVNADGSLIGLKEQVDPMKATHAFLFADAPAPKGGAEPGGGEPGAFDMNTFLRGGNSNAL